MITKAARRYTTALYDAALEKGILKEVTRDIINGLSLINSNKALELFFASPVISKVKKLKIVKDIFGGNFSELTMTFIDLLVTRGRESLTKGIFEDFINLTKEKDGIVDVYVKTSVTLSEDEKANLKKKIDSYTKKKSEMNFEIDKNIIGGFVAKINDTVLDASIKRQLEKLKVKFKEGDYILN
ncbi:MAG: ATP synthase F1 subunit delta [Bacteroidota bacterium]|nr:ATP synthase F1 subunit delta [Bacteroidota bacterium]